VILVGRLVATPGVHTTGSGVPVTTVRVATNDREEPAFHDVVLWRQLAEFAGAYMSKGRQAYIEGRLQVRTWEAADGSKRRTVEVVADTFKAISLRSVERAAS
jgi:single-strand DNA-binding protein